MSEIKYLSVIHKPSGEVVSAYKFENDATWAGRDKDELIATPIYCKSGEKVKMIFIKTYPKKNRKIVHGYFRSTPGEQNLISSPNGESVDHKNAKEKIYNGLLSGERKIDGEPINRKLIKDIKVEYRIGSKECIIPDVIILFKEIHPKYGLGIFFEIQLSNQSEAKTNERNYQRVIEGLSGVWFFYEDFSKDMTLLNQNVNVSSHKKLMMELESIMENNFIAKINEYGRRVDNKIKEYESSVINISTDALRNLEHDFNTNKMELISTANNEINKIQIENNKLVELKRLAESLDIIVIKETINKMMFEIEGKIIEHKKGMEGIYKKINTINFGEFGEKINNKFIVGEQCPKCNKDMKIGKSMGGYNWYCPNYHSCGGIIKGGNI